MTEKRFVGSRTTFDYGIVDLKTGERIVLYTNDGRICHKGVARLIDVIQSLENDLIFQII